MKKLYILTSLIFILPFVTSAASFIVTPSSGSYTTGDSITLHISVNPSGSTIYTAMLDAGFPVDKFEIVSFTLNDSMLPLKQAGYDALDNSKGVLTKTGGYSGGINTVTSFGTIVLKTKGSGVGTFTINDSSKLLDANNADQQSGTQTASFTIAPKKAPVVAPPVAPQTTVKKETVQQVPDTAVSTTTSTTTEEVVEEVVVSEPEVVATSSQLASVAGTETANYMIYWVIGIIVMVGLFSLVYFVFLRRY